MAHLNQQKFCERIRNKFPNYFYQKRVLDIGSLDINGSNRYLFRACEYLGIDLKYGNGVDLVCYGHKLNKPDNYFDVVISTETFEHDKYYKETVQNAMRMLKSGGLFIFTCASTGRNEHGTKSNQPEDSPSTNDYYKILTEDDFKNINFFIETFPEGIFESHAHMDDDLSKGTDLYFYSFKNSKILRNIRYLICDDVNEKDFWKLEKLREKYFNLKVTCFVMGKDAGDYLKRDWIEVGCHGWEHTYPPECERNNQEEFIIKGLKALRKYLPRRFGFRAPGFQMTASTYPILRKLGFSYIAHQKRIQAFSSNFLQGKMINTHIYDNSLSNVENGEFDFLSNGFSECICGHNGMKTISHLGFEEKER